MYIGIHTMCRIGSACSFYYDFFIDESTAEAQLCMWLLLIGRPTHQEVKAAAKMASMSSAIQSRDVSSTEVCFFMLLFLFVSFTAWSSSPH